jgi:hypothetical protein
LQCIVEFFKSSFTPLPTVRFSKIPFSQSQSAMYGSDDEMEEEAARLEMKMYKKSISARKVLALRERKEVQEHKEECDRIEANEVFFGVGKPVSKEKKERDEMMKKFKERRVDWGNFGPPKDHKCRNAEACRLCNNYYGEELDVFDCEVEKASCMPTVVEINVDRSDIGRKRKLAEAQFAVMYNRGMLQNSVALLSQWEESEEESEESEAEEGEGRDNMQLSNSSKSPLKSPGALLSGKRRRRV